MEQGEILLHLIVHLVLTGLPVVAATLLAARLGVRRVPVLLAIGLAASGAGAMLAFWAYYGSRELGESFSFFLLFGSALVAGWSLYGGRIESALLRQLATPLALWALGSAFLVFLGFLHGGAASPVAASGIRFVGPLPSDNDIPHFFTEWFYFHSHHGTPPIYQPGWHFSDRPPLQVGYMLSQRGLMWDTKLLDYQLIGVLLQQLWIVGLWALLVAARVGRVTRALAIGTVLLSDVAIVNGFYVWPKLLPVAMLLAAAALVVTPLWLQLRRNLWGAALVAALLGLAMLGHGASIFGAIPIALIAAYRGLPSWRWIGVAALTGIVLMAPWSAYQKYGDPPGNRLTKWMLAGVVEIDQRGTGEAIVDSYREAGIGGAIHDKAENFVTMSGGGPMAEAVQRAEDAIGEGRWGIALKELRAILFLFLIPSLGLLVIAPVVMLFGRRRGRSSPDGDWSFALTCLLIVAVGAVCWGLLLFGNQPSRAVVHAGTFALPVLAFCGCVAGLRATYPRFANWFVPISALLMLAVYVPALDPLPGTGYSALGALLTVASLAGFGWVAWRSSEPVPTEPAGALGDVPRARAGAAASPSAVAS
jgi:hypothetical protein